MDHKAETLSRSEANDAGPSISQHQENVFLFVPNVIGYVRILLAISALSFMPYHPRWCCSLYSISCLLDALDGYAARWFNQSTRFGTVLDMVTDRCTTTCLLVFLAVANPGWSFVFQFLISLDLSSHYMHMYATLAMGNRGQSHKETDQQRSWLMHLYYTNKNVLFAVCAANELCFLSLYLLSFDKAIPSHLRREQGSLHSANIRLGSSADPLPLLYEYLMEIYHWYPLTVFFGTNPSCTPGLTFHSAVKTDMTLTHVVFLLTVVPMLFKQYINVVQIIVASKWLAEGDIVERRQKKKKKH